MMGTTNGTEDTNGERAARSSLKLWRARFAKGVRFGNGLVLFQEACR